MDDQSRNLILATALSFLVILGWFVLGPILFPSAFPPPTEQTDAPARGGQTAGEPTTAAPPAAGAAAPAPELAAAAPADAARRRWRGPRGCRSRPPRLEGSLSLTGGRIDDLKLTELHGDGRARLADRHAAEPRRARRSAYYSLLRLGAGRARSTADAVPGADTPWQIESGEHADRDHAGDAALGQRPGADLPPDLRGRRELHVHASPRASRTTPAPRCGCSPTAPSPATASRPT